MTETKRLTFSFGPESRSVIFPAGDLTEDVVNKCLAGTSYPCFGWIARPKVIVDIGAHVGSFAVRMGMIFPEAKIDCYEPNPEIFDYLQQNVRGLNIIAHNAAVSVDTTNYEVAAA